MFSVRVTLIVLIGLAAGLVAFKFYQYNHATLVIKAKTFEKGENYIIVENKDSKSQSRLRFLIGNDDGETSLYPIELPRIRLQSVTIPPLASPGRYEIDSITLQNNSISYIWDQAMACSLRMLESEVVRSKACGENSPVISIDHKNNIVISSIPGSGNSLRFRIAMAVFTTVGVFLCGLYLFGAPDANSKVGFAVRCCWLFVGLLFIFQLVLLWRYAVDIPYYEEWEFFDPSALPNGLSWQWLNQQVSHQRMMVFTKLMAWLNFKLFSLDFVKLKIMNYAVFGLLLTAVARFRKKVLADDFRFFPLFMIFLLSPIAYEVHAASFQGGETFAVLCSVLMLFFVISNQPSYKKSVLFSLCAIASMCSLSAGAIYSLVFLLCDTLYTSANLHVKRMERAVALRCLLLRWGIVLPATLLWLQGFKKPDPAIWALPTSLLLPTEGKFWEMFLDLLSFGFGFDIESPFPGMVCLAILLVPTALLLKNKETRWEPATWRVITALAGSLAVVALITIGRGNMGFSIKVSRYAIFGMLLIPYGAMAWWLALRSHGWRLGLIALMWGFLAVTYHNNWDYGVYRDIRQLEALNLECVERYSNGTGDGACPGSFVFPIGNYFDNARTLGVHFTRQFVPANGAR